MSYNPIRPSTGRVQRANDRRERQRRRRALWALQGDWYWRQRDKLVEVRHAFAVVTTEGSRDRRARLAWKAMRT